LNAVAEQEPAAFWIEVWNEFVRDAMHVIIEVRCSTAAIEIIDEEAFRSALLDELQ
jgi:hypothetical protein